jgi:hypothetical protein
MHETATARAQAAEALEQAAVALKRSMNASRKAVQAIRQAQINQFGVVVENPTGPEAIGHDRSNEDR